MVKCVDAVERLPLLDAIADLLEDFDACAFVDRGAGRAGETVEVQTIDAFTVPSSGASTSAVSVPSSERQIDGPCASMIFCIWLRAAPLSSKSLARR